MFNNVIPVRALLPTALLALVAGGLAAPAAPAAAAPASTSVGLHCHDPDHVATPGLGQEFPNSF
jgi:hypothetical protein